MAAETDEQDHSAGLGRAITRGIIIGLPVAYVLLVLGLWLLFDQDFTKALETAALPGLLLGGFFGGFFGVSVHELEMSRREKQERSRQRHS